MGTNEKQKTGGWRANKWIRAAIPALLLHCSIGTVYCWSIFSQEIADYIGHEKGSVECHNRMLRRFIPKGKSIENYTADEIMIFADIINGLPRKRLKYRTPEELLDEELDRIFAA